MASKIEIVTKNMELNDRINEYVTKKLSKLDSFCVLKNAQQTFLRQSTRQLKKCSAKLNG
jgi:ribosome-associated translation inhibitor RaiA